MQNDFKENYIEEQKRLAAERRARLAKIGMGNDPASSKGVPSEQNRRPAPIAQNQYPNKREPSSAATRMPAPAPQPVRPQQPQYTQRRQQPVSRPMPEQRPVQPPVRPVQPQPVRQPYRGDVNSPAKPEAKAQQPAKPVNQAPAQQRRAPVNNGYKSPSAAHGHYNTIKKPAPTETDIFKKELSDNDSRAMMFALTGRAEKPDDGGEVDIINMGRIRAPKREKDEEKKKKFSFGLYIGRPLAAIGLALLMVITLVLSSVALIAHGPSETVRDLLVQSAMQASATKWVPYIFLSEETVDGIINKSEETVKDIVSIDDYVGDSENNITEDEWANAKDGMIFKTVSGPTFKAYVLLVKDPSRVFVGTSQESLPGKKYGDDIFHITKFYNAVAAINGGEFPDNGGTGTGHTPIGLTYSKGKCINPDDSGKRTFLGITGDNKLVVSEGMSREKATELGIRDAVSFQKGNTLIQNEGEELIFYYQDGNTGTAQRTGIGQRADGTMILVVTDGRTASSLGATHNDMINLMVSFGAVTAGLLDGGSSSLMYYEDYYNKYDYDYEKLDEYQKLGLVNKYKAFTEPRKIPTFFIVGEE